MISRRRFCLDLSAAALALPAGARAACAPRGDRLEAIGIQLYTLRREMARDVEGTLARVAEIGYDEVEFAGYHGVAPREVRAMLERVGLRAPAAHVGFDALEGDWDRVLADAGTVGHQYVVIPWIPPNRRTLDGYRRVADVLNRRGGAAREAGIRLGYHNHEFEFTPTEGRVPYDVLLEETDPELVVLEIDLYWIAVGGHDPLAYITRYPGRCALVHVKDRDAQGRMVDVGSGTLDFARVFAAREQAGLRHAFVEHDDPADPWATARTSYEHLRTLEF